MHTQTKKGSATVIYLHKNGISEGENRNTVSQGRPSSKTDEFAKFAGRRTGDTVFFSPWQQRSRIWA